MKWNDLKEGDKVQIKSTKETRNIIMNKGGNWIVHSIRKNKNGKTSTILIILDNPKWKLDKPESHRFEGIWITENDKIQIEKRTEKK